MRQLLPLLALTTACVGPLHETRETLSVRDSYATVSIDIGAGNLALALSDVTEVHMERVIRCRGDATPHLRAEVVDNVLTIASSGERCSVDHLIVLPRAASTTARTGAGDMAFRSLSADLTASTGAGDIEAQDITGFADLDTDAGNIEVIGLVGGLLATTAAGNVHVTDARLHTLDLSSSAGNVEAELLDAVDYARLNSSAGRVDLRLPAGVYAIDATSGAGSVHVDNLEHDPNASQALDLHSGAGNVRATGI